MRLEVFNPANVTWAYRLYHWFCYGLDWLYPPVCGGCQRKGYRWCPDCHSRVILLSDPLCNICGLPQLITGICPSCQETQPIFHALRSWAVFEGPLRSAMLRLKYNHDLALGETLAEPAAGYARRLKWPVDLVVPVPLGRKRMRERGYNQVATVAMPLAMMNGWRYAPKALRRLRETRSQVGLSMEERRENVRGAFGADGRLVRDRIVLLVDDVATTGATVLACAQALVDGGARSVYAFTLARALPRHGLKYV